MPHEHGAFAMRIMGAGSAPNARTVRVGAVTDDSIAAVGVPVVVPIVASCTTSNRHRDRDHARACRLAIRAFRGAADRARQGVGLGYGPRGMLPRVAQRPLPRGV